MYGVVRHPVPAFFSTEIFTMFMVSKSCIRWFVLSPLAALLVGFTVVHAEPVSWMERYALAKDREAMLAELIPGSDDYFFYHCLYKVNLKILYHQVVY